MQYSKKDIDKARYIALPVSMASGDHQDILTILEKFAQNDLDVLVLNFEKTKFIDSAGLGMLLIAKQFTEDNNKKLILQKVGSSVAKIFDTMNFDKLFTIEYIVYDK